MTGSRLPTRRTYWQRAPPPSELDCCLTGLEFSVLDLMLTGLPVRHIARMTRMSEKQVSTHKCNALKKLNANNLLQLLL